MAKILLGSFLLFFSCSDFVNQAETFESNNSIPTIDSINLTFTYEPSDTVILSSLKSLYLKWDIDSSLQDTFTVWEVTPDDTLKIASIQAPNWDLRIQSDSSITQASTLLDHGVLTSKPIIEPSYVIQSWSFNPKYREVLNHLTFKGSRTKFNLNTIDALIKNIKLSNKYFGLALIGNHSLHLKHTFHYLMGSKHTNDDWNTGASSISDNDTSSVETQLIQLIEDLTFLKSQVVDSQVLDSFSSTIDSLKDIESLMFSISERIPLLMIQDENDVLATIDSLFIWTKSIYGSESLLENIQPTLLPFYTGTANVK